MDLLPKRTQPPLSLEKRSAFFGLIFAAAIALIYSLGLVYVIFSTEEKLMTSMLESRLDGIITYDLAFGNKPRLDAVSKLYIEDDPQRPIPERLKKLPLGYTELVEDEELHVYVADRDGKRYVLTRVQTEFENWEHTIFWGAILFFVGLCLFFMFLFRFLAKRFLTPLDQLTQATKQTEALLKSGDYATTENVFKADWPNNEIGVLAHNLQELNDRLKHVLQNERNFLGEISHELRTPLFLT